MYVYMKRSLSLAAIRSYRVAYPSKAVLRYLLRWAPAKSIVTLECCVKTISNVSLHAVTGVECDYSRLSIKGKGILVG